MTLNKNGPISLDGSIPEQSIEQINIDGQTVTEVISRNAVSYYDHEEELNDKKKTKNKLDEKESNNKNKVDKEKFPKYAASQICGN